MGIKTRFSTKTIFSSETLCTDMAFQQIQVLIPIALLTGGTTQKKTLALRASVSHL